LYWSPQYLIDEVYIDIDCGKWHMFYYSWQCSKPCGGGVMSRKVLCFVDNKTVDANNCDPSLIHFSSETCNNNPCSKGEWCFKRHIFKVFTFNCILVSFCGMIYVAWLLTLTFKRDFYVLLLGNKEVLCLSRGYPIVFKNNIKMK
jgi:hypothetical protein